jgi:hypothetical protein
MSRVQPQPLPPLPDSPREFERVHVPAIREQIGVAIDEHEALSFSDHLRREGDHAIVRVRLHPDLAGLVAPVRRRLEETFGDSARVHGRYRGSRTMYSVVVEIALNSSGPPFDVAVQRLDDSVDWAAGEPTPIGRHEGAGAQYATEVAAPPEPPDLTVVGPDRQRGMGGGDAGAYALEVRGGGADVSPRVVPLGEHPTTLGRRGVGSGPRASVALDLPKDVSRLQVAFVPTPEGAAPFALWNLGRGPVRIDGREVEGAGVARVPASAEELPAGCVAAVPADAVVEVGEEAPLRIRLVRPEGGGDLTVV